MHFSSTPPSHTYHIHIDLDLRTCVQGKPLHRVWQQKMNPAIEVHRQVELCLRLSVEMEDILDEHRDEYALPGILFTECVATM